MISRDKSAVVFCVTAAGAVVYNVTLAAILLARGSLWQSAICSFFAAASSLALLRGVYDAERQARWRDRDGLEAAIRFPRRESRN